MTNGRAALATVLATICLTLGAAAPAVAGGANGYGYLGHTTPDVPRHWILDNPGPDPHSPPVTCVYGGAASELKRMVIREPVMFASGGAPQRVGWRAVIQGADVISGGWQVYDATPFSRTNATGAVAADFQPKTFTFPSNVEVNRYYRVAYQLVWYGPNGTTVVDEAGHLAYWYLIKNLFPTQERCDSTNAPARTAGTPRGAPTEGPHTGQRGAHWILEMVGPTPELPPVTCHYVSDQLDRLAIRQPIVFARDSGPGVQRQTVGWKAIVQKAVLGSGLGAWSFLGETSVTRKRASELVWAGFRPKQVDIDELEPLAFRVIYRLYWYKPNGAIVGRADHIPAWYKSQAGGLGSWFEGYCPLDGSG